MYTGIVSLIQKPWHKDPMMKTKQDFMECHWWLLIAADFGMHQTRHHRCSNKIRKDSSPIITAKSANVGKKHTVDFPYHSNLDLFVWWCFTDCTIGCINHQTTIWENMFGSLFPGIVAMQIQWSNSRILRYRRIVFVQENLGGGFKYLLFSSPLGEDSHFD